MIVGVEGDAQQLAGAHLGHRAEAQGPQPAGDRLALRVCDPRPQPDVDLGQPAHQADVPATSQRFPVSRSQAVT
jgi:hypothetical protein